MRTFKNKTEDWREQASELRARAGTISDKEARRTLLNQAKGYDLLAERARSPEDANIKNIPSEG